MHMFVLDGNHESGIKNRRAMGAELASTPTGAGDVRVMHCEDQATDDINPSKSGKPVDCTQSLRKWERRVPADWRLEWTSCKCRLGLGQDRKNQESGIRNQESGIKGGHGCVVSFAVRGTARLGCQCEDLTTLYLSRSIASGNAGRPQTGEWRMEWTDLANEYPTGWRGLIFVIGGVDASMLSIATLWTGQEWTGQEWRIRNQESRIKNRGAMGAPCVACGELRCSGVKARVLTLVRIYRAQCELGAESGSTPPTGEASISPIVGTRPRTIFVQENQEHQQGTQEQQARESCAHRARAGPIWKHCWLRTGLARRVPEPGDWRGGRREGRDERGDERREMGVDQLQVPVGQLQVRVE
ncbi:hypothetical protein FIBSPDRAFT_902586 [Athelia psychrophila]|uniref:Uncharacterized protein n=1 Tax=Athelia psychrophila TaxID=1759441 RepID=A0A167X2D0_9AGAM|nr:hypothetical protein FIBSPDRAFT_902586 [Fibularhizoctonia sp. CBS 109695]